MKKKASLMIIALFLASLNMRPAITSVAPLLGSISSQLGMNAAVGSLLTSIPVLCMGFFSPVAVGLSARWGVERVMGVALVVTGVGTVIRFVTHSTPVLLVTALIAGMGIAMIGPLLAGFIKRHFPTHVPPMIAVYTVALTLGAAVSTGLAIPFQRSLQSWQNSLGIWAILAFVAAITWWLFVNRQVEAPKRGDSTGTQAKLPWTNGRAWLITLSFGLMASLFYSFTAWLPEIIQSMGYTKTYSANALTIFVAIQIPVSLVLPMVLKHFPSRRLWLVVESCFELLGLTLLELHVSPWLACTLIGIGAGGLFSLNLLLPIDATSHHHESAAWSAKAQSVGYIIGALGPIMLGWIYDATHSFASAVVVMFVIIVVMIVIQVAATRKRRHPSIVGEAS